MAGQSKTPDLVVVESPYEYQLASQAELIGLLRLAAICRTYQIPVRVHQIHAGEQHLFFREGIDDCAIALFFRGCDYRNGLKKTELEGLTEKSNIIVTGGSLLYEDYLLDAKVSSSRISPGLVSNYAPEEGRRFTFVKGCVAKCADFLSRELYVKGKRKPELVIDANSAVKDFAQFAPFQAYRFYSGGYVGLGVEYYRILESLG